MQIIEQQLKKIIQKAKQKIQIKPIKNLREKVNQPNFWKNRRKAERISRKLSQLEENQKFWREAKEEAQALLLLLKDKNNHSLQQEIKKELSILKQALQKKEKEMLPQGKYDQNNAIISIYAGAGGIDAMDWAGMLLRMYLRFCEKKSWKTYLLNQSFGDEAGIKSAAFLVKTDFAYRIFKSEKGVHRLIRLSPFDADHARHTSFAKVEVLPEITEKKIALRDEDLEISTFRSSAPGGQKVNKTSSAVRIKHIPSNIIVECQNERSQHQNKIQALKILKAKLWQRAQEKKRREKLKERGKNIPAEWGRQIRSYVLHPYKQIKDHQTGKIVQDVEAVLKGRLEPFLKKPYD